LAGASDLSRSSLSLEAPAKHQRTHSLDTLERLNTWLSPLEHTSIPVLPDFPSDQNNEAIEALMTVIRRRLNRGTPPGG